MFLPVVLAQATPNLPPQQIPGLERQQFPAPRLSVTPTRSTATSSTPVAQFVQPNPAPLPTTLTSNSINRADSPVAAPLPVPSVPVPAVPSIPNGIAFIPQQVRPLPGQLDDVPVFNSNSPEMVRSEGILLSTFPNQGKADPRAHLNYPLQGRFDVFAHHVTQSNSAAYVPSLYLGLLATNPTSQTITVRYLQAASFLSTPDAPFRSLPAIADNPIGYVFSGPGSRATNQILRGVRQTFWPTQVIIPPGESRMLTNLILPLPKSNPRAAALRAQQEFRVNEQGYVDPKAPLIADVSPFGAVSSSNGRTTLMYLDSDGPLYLAHMAMYARTNPDGSERAPTLDEWQGMLYHGRLVSPRDITPTPPTQTYGARFFYGRVAGVSRGSQWLAKLTDDGRNYLQIPNPGQAISYGISTLQRGTLGTGQIQSAPMLVRYPDTAYYSHGNYGVHYSVTIPLHNPTQQTRSVNLTLQTPLKDDFNPNGLQFMNPPAPQVFFRGTVRVVYLDDLGQEQVRFVHLVQRRGQLGDSLAILNLRPGETRMAQIDFLYPPDATPPQVLTVNTLPNVNYENTVKVPSREPLTSLAPSPQ
ncbi:DUF3370 domain-containing protein [Thermosynechococcaceae cyanobacterium BACA0444]|uniref:DUF3370 domain-containing protein n=1 Tax=Pseudocalidococcus azoricus BACA0444 TaxID=2918990 RepID=A0AAE4FSC7_9CYAN|nr:DUF3370 domain-containing protein [Pseudocalidococcus azoricus]MDS3861226.1 DUF3370 domain-containing protein [Pseudocalidococcus azoricus BACA0444]